MFAAANTNLIQLFSTFTFENIGNLKGHNGKASNSAHNGLYVDYSMCVAVTDRKRTLV